MAEAFSIKGSSLRSKLDYLREVHGKAAAEELKGWLREKGVVLLLVSDWYPHELYTQLNERIAERFFGNNLKRLREVGVFSAERALSSVYKAYVEKGDFEAFLRRIASLHQRFFNRGAMEVRASPRSCEILLSGAPVYPEADMQIAAGFYIGAARNFGLENPVCDIRLGGKTASFLLRW